MTPAMGFRRGALSVRASWALAAKPSSTLAVVTPRRGVKGLSGCCGGLGYVGLAIFPRWRCLWGGYIFVYKYSTTTFNRYMVVVREFPYFFSTFLFFTFSFFYGLDFLNQIKSGPKRCSKIPFLKNPRKSPDSNSAVFVCLVVPLGNDFCSFTTPSAKSP